jgi:hypothetical protein
MGHFLLSNHRRFSRWGAPKQQISQIATKKVNTGKLSFFSALDQHCPPDGKIEAGAPKTPRLDEKTPALVAAGL